MQSLSSPDMERGPSPTTYSPLPLNPSDPSFKFIPYVPAGWSAPCVTKRGVFSKNTKHIKALRASLAALGVAKVSGPVEIQVIFQMPIPKSMSKKNTSICAGLFQARKPDLSNMVKLFEDALKDVVIEDDARVCCMTSCKMYHPCPGVKFRVFPVEDAWYP